MNSEVFSEWLRRQGYSVYKTESSYWYNQGLRALQAFPYHWIINPREAELEELLRKTKFITLRYSTTIGASEGKISYHAILDDKSYGIDKLGKWARKNVRKGLAHSTVREISFERLANEGYELQLDTLQRQGRGLKLSKNEWETRCLSTKDLPGFKAWGAIVQGKLAATVITFQMEKCVYMLYQQCLRDYLPLHINNALGYVVTTEMISNPEVDCILYGLHSLDAPSSVDEFKFRMGYKALPVRQRVFFNPMIKPFISPVTYLFVYAARKIFKTNPLIAKTEGMIRFYNEGKLPLSSQSWPEVLMGERDRILIAV